MLPSSVCVARHMSHTVQELQAKNAELRMCKTELEQGQLQDTTTYLDHRRSAIQSFGDPIR